MDPETDKPAGSINLDGLSQYHREKALEEIDQLQVKIEEIKKLLGLGLEQPPDPEEEE
jgi:hypothetical protein